MRVTAGRYKGRLLAFPKSGVRPSKGMTRQAVFNILGDRVAGARVLDLFAGSGALGIEALSRGAAAAVFVEQSGVALRCLLGNTSGLENVEVRRGDVVRVLPRLAGREFDLVLADPPYRKGWVAKTLDGLAAHRLLAPGGTAVVEHSEAEPAAAPTGWDQVTARRYGSSCVTFIRRPA